ncbi:transposase [Vibrio coralliilyticus]
MRKRFTDQDKKNILEEAEQNYVVDVATKYGISRKTIYKWRNKAK